MMMCEFQEYVISFLAMLEKTNVKKTLK